METTICCDKISCFYLGNDARCGATIIVLKDGECITFSKEEESCQKK